MNSQHKNGALLIQTFYIRKYYYALINLEFGPYAKIFVVTSYRTDLTSFGHNKYFPYGPNSRLIRALLYTHTSKTTKSQCFPLLLWIEVQLAHTPVRTQAYGRALSQSNFSIFCLVYNKDTLSGLCYMQAMVEQFS